MKRRWFLYFFRRSISQRVGRVLIASLSVTLAVAIVTSMIGITSGIKEKLGSELKAYGANIIVSPQKGGSLSDGMLEGMRKLDGVEDATGQVFARASIDKQAIEIIGLDIGRLKERGWRLFGSWPEKQGEIIAGINLKGVLKLEKGASVSLESEGKTVHFTVSGFTEKGGAEDNSLIMSVGEAREITGAPGALDAILVSGRSGRLESIVSRIKASYPSVAVKTLRQIAFAEESLLMKIQLLMAMVTTVVLLATAISVASTMGANVLERREEIGLMKAIGARKKDISMFYMTEAVLIGMLGGVSGFFLGWLAAEAVSVGAFHSYVSIAFYLPFLSLCIGLLIAVAAAHFPVRNAMKYDPAVILRGE